MASQLSALCIDEEDIDGNKELTEYYQKILPQLKRFLVRDIDPGVIRKIAVMLHATEPDVYKWEDYATEMGVTTESLKEIRVIAAWIRPGPPLMIVMKEYLSTRNGNFGHIVKALLDTERFDVLEKIKPFVEGLLGSKNGVKNVCFSEMNLLSCGSSGRIPFVKSEVPQQLNCMAASPPASESG